MSTFEYEIRNRSILPAQGRENLVEAVMGNEGLLGLWASHFGISILIWGLIAIGLLYLARPWLRPVLRIVCRLLARHLGAAGRGLNLAAAVLHRRHREYLRGVLLLRLQQQVARRYRGIQCRLNRDLGGHAVLQRRINEQISILERDYQRTRDQMPEEPAWMKTALALIQAPPHRTDPRVEPMLQEIHDTLARASQDTMAEYRHENRERMKLLRELLPEWRTLGDRVGDLERSVAGVADQARRLDEALARFQQARDGLSTPRTVLLASGGLLVLGLTLLLALGLTAMLGFHLLTPPLQGILGMPLTGTQGESLSVLAAGVLVLAAVMAGGMVSESRRITTLIPGIESWDIAGRRRLLWGGVVLLVLVTMVSAALAGSRSLFAIPDNVVYGLLEGPPEVAPPVLAWLSVSTLMVLGALAALLPALAAIPLQMTLQAGGVVGGAVGVVTLRLTAFILFRLGWLMHTLADLLPRCYDLLIFLPLQVERVVRRMRRRNK